MIYGGVNFFGFSTETKTNEIARLLELPGTKTVQETHWGLCCGAVINRRLMASAWDFFYVDAVAKMLVLFDGNIYNCSELAHTLKDKPSEILNPVLVARLFLKMGPDFVNELNGDFAICIYLAESRELFLFRDHVGVKPLAYTINNGGVFFSTGVLGLCRAFFNQEVIFMDPMLSFEKAVNHLLTINPIVKKLTPGHYMHFKENQQQEIKYWFPEKVKINNNLRYEQVVEKTGRLLIDSVAIRCDKNYNAGAHLSGGIDSGIVAAIARKNYAHQDPFPGFSWSPDGPANIDPVNDERVLIREIACMNNIKPVFCNPTGEELNWYVQDPYNNLAYFLEEKTMENALKEGVNLIMSGWGGNEFISKLDTGIDSDLLFQGRFKKFFEKNPLNKPRKLAQTLFYLIILPALGILDWSMRKAYRESTRYFKKEYKANDRETIRKSFFYRSRRERHLNFIYNYFISERTEIQHHIGFRKGIEFRYPLLDVRIIEFMLSVPSHLMVRGEKERVILREISNKWLPPTVWDRAAFMDPVLLASKRLKIQELGGLYLSEVQNWKENPDLYFVDFDLLLRDVQKAAKKKASENPDHLYSSVFTLKVLHEFSKSYRSLSMVPPL